MGLETCFHVPTIVPTTTTRPLGQRAKFNRIPTTHKLNSQQCKGLTRATTFRSSDLSPVGRSRRGGGVVCCASAAGKVVEATDTDWSSVVEGNVGNQIIVEFWAPWCGPCRMIAPIMDELAKEYEGKIGCYKVNTDQCPNIATKYGIRSVPTVTLFKNGEKKESIVGDVPKSTLTAAIDKYLQM